VKRCHFSLELGHEGLGNRVNYDDPLGRHANLALIHEGAESGGFYRSSKSASSRTISGALPPSSRKHRFQMLRSTLGDDPADGGRAREIDSTNGGMVDQGADDLARTRGALVTTLTTPCGSRLRQRLR